MRAATSWKSDRGDDPKRGWSVMGRLMDRQAIKVRAAREARQRQAERANTISMMTAALGVEQYREDLIARWRGGFSVLAFLFAPPDSEAIRMLDGRGDYLNIRSGNTWDLFFPGYYESDDPHLEGQVGAQPAGQRFMSNWYFSASEFDTLRRHVEQESAQRWQYSGGIDLVLATVWIPERGEPVVDWDSTQSGRLTDAADGTRSRTLGEVVELITRDLEESLEDASYGVGAVTDPLATPKAEGAGKKIIIGALAGILAALGKDAIGL